MNPFRRNLLRTAGGLAASVAMGGALAQVNPPGYTPIGWEGLVPPGWDPMAAFREAGLDPRGIAEGSAGEIEASRKLREIWDRAPVRMDLQGARIRLPGYVVPLELSSGSVREFLLVPYFGACIHSPPPPANQMVLVRLDRAASLQTMDAVWVWGELSVQRSRTEWGQTGYRLQARGTSPYRETSLR